jgi:hypothetical protein
LGNIIPGIYRQKEARKCDFAGCSLFRVMDVIEEIMDVRGTMNEYLGTMNE